MCKNIYVNLAKPHYSLVLHISHFEVFASKISRIKAHSVMIEKCSNCTLYNTCQIGICLQIISLEKRHSAVLQVPQVSSRSIIFSTTGMKDHKAENSGRSEYCK